MGSDYGIAILSLDGLEALLYYRLHRILFGVANLEYQLRYDKPLEFTSGQKVIAKIDSSCLLEAVHHTSSLIKQISNFPINIFEILGMRNLSAFVGEIFAASLITHSKGEFIKNPHQDGYPDLLLLDEEGKSLFKKISDFGGLRDKGPFSPFANGGIEVKATCGSVPDANGCRRLGLVDKPNIGDQRIKVLRSYDWKAHHRDTNNLMGILWDFIDGTPQVVAVFFCADLVEDDWGKIVQPKDGGGRTTSVSIMTRVGVKKMYDNWVVVLNDDRYINFLNRYNNSSMLGVKQV